MIVHIEKLDRTEELDFKGKVSGLLEKLKINPETVLVARENELLIADDELSDSDEIRLLSVVSGG